MTIIQTKGELPERKKDDVYCTPDDLAYEALKQLLPPSHFQSPYNILDIGCGNGVWGHAFSHLTQYQSLTGIDIRSREEIEKQCLDDNLNDYLAIYNDFVNEDYLQWEPYEKFDVIMGNPPFYCAEDIVHKSLSDLKPFGYLILLLKSRFLNTKGRYERLWKKYRPIKVAMSVSRISFYGKATNDEEYAIYLWQKDNYPEYPKLVWLDWKGA